MDKNTYLECVFRKEKSCKNRRSVGGAIPNFRWHPAAGAPG